MRSARYERSEYGGRTAHWPFALPDVVPALPWVAPEFRSSLERILSTSRFYLQIEVSDRRQARMRQRSPRR